MYTFANIIFHKLLKYAYIFTFICFAMLIGIEVFALPPFPDAGSSPPCGGPWGPCVPIDGGISLLLAAGAIYGGKSIYKNFKNNKE